MSSDSISAILDLLVLVDGETVATTLPPGMAENPTSVPTPLIYMIANSDRVDFGQASKELKITASTGDVIRWSAASLSLNSAYQVSLYKFHPVRGADLISTPAPLVIEATMPLPNPQDPAKPGTQTRKYSFWQTTVLEPGELTYAFNLMIMNRSGKQLGYYYWDPFISIKA